MEMTRPTLVADLALCSAAIVPALLRWLRVAQREHYLAAPELRFAARWWFGSSVNAALFAVGVAGVVAAGWQSLVALATGVVLLVGPIGLSLRGRTAKLAWTARLRRLALLAAALLVGAGLLGAGVDGVRGSIVAAAAAGLCSPAVIALSMLALAPIERRLGQRYVDRASEVVARTRPRIVAITGSYGKTSTKVYLAHLLGSSFAVVASPRSFNNRAGLARTVNELLVPGTEVLVAEMGTYGVGEIADMVSWLPPEVAVLTAIGPVHLERFKTLETTLRAKSEIAVGASVVVVNDDDPYLSSFADEVSRRGQRVLRCSASRPDADVAVLARGEEIEILVAGVPLGAVALGAASPYVALSNVACALGAAMALGVDVASMLTRLPSLPVVENRLTVRTAGSGATILDDTYNSNPSGTTLALQALAGLRAPGHRCLVVTPGMVELGPLQFDANRAFAGAAAAVATDVVVVGRTNRKALVQGVRAYSSAVRLRSVKNREAAVAIVRDELGDGDVVLYENDLPDHFA
jgi:UDP-N-acetylmuramoyl-tripeptide--D-alanyl-D-alanine ligase